MLQEGLETFGLLPSRLAEHARSEVLAGGLREERLGLGPERQLARAY